MDRQAAIELIEKFLAASMSGDKEGSRAVVSPDLVFTFTGKRRFERAEQTGEFNAKRYASVKKDITTYDVCPEEEGRLVVYCLGTLFGSWPTSNTSVARLMSLPSPVNSAIWSTWLQGWLISPV